MSRLKKKRKLMDKFYKEELKIRLLAVLIVYVYAILGVLLTYYNLWPDWMTR